MPHLLYKQNTNNKNYEKIRTHVNVIERNIFLFLKYIPWNECFFITKLYSFYFYSKKIYSKNIHDSLTTTSIWIVKIFSSEIGKIDFILKRLISSNYTKCFCNSFISLSFGWWRVCIKIKWAIIKISTRKKLTKGCSNITRNLLFWNNWRIYGLVLLSFFNVWT